MSVAASIVAARGGIATRAEILQRGATSAQLAAAVRAGEIVRVRRAHFAVPQADADAVSAVHVGGVLCGLSAARSFGVWAGDDLRLHVAVPPNASRLRIHHQDGRIVADLDGREVVRHWIDDGFRLQCWRVDIFACLMQCVAWSDAETAIAVLDTARTRHRLPMTSLRRVFEHEHPRSRVLLSRSRVGSDSGLESIVRQRLNGIGYRIRQQVRLPRVGRVDMLVDGTRVVIEVDGREHHGSGAAFDEDRRRDAEAVRLGFVVLRFTYRQVVQDWPWCEQTIRSAALRFQDLG